MFLFSSRVTRNMCTREEFVKVFDKILSIEIEDMKQNYTLPETAINWVEKVFILTSLSF